MGSGENVPPSSLAITSALSSTDVTAMLLFEFPNEIPMATRSPGIEPLAVESSADILSILLQKNKSLGGVDVVVRRSSLVSWNRRIPVSTFFLEEISLARPHHPQG